MSIIQIFNTDCVKAMKQLPEKSFDLAIVDPPYGIGKTWKKNRKGEKAFDIGYSNATIPDDEYFALLKKVSKEYIIWGANFFLNFWPSKNVIVWDKQCTWEKEHKAEAEIAVTSLNHRPVNIFRHTWSGGRKGPETGISIIHPHQKPVGLYRWCLEKYAKKGWKILDTHLGSGSIALACIDLGFDLTAYEIDPKIFKKTQERIRTYELKKLLESL